MEAAMISLDKLIAYPKNAKSHDFGSIHRSIGQWGYIERIVVNQATGHILSGHGRTDVLRQLKAKGNQPPDGIVADNGHWMIPIDIVNVPESQEGAVTIALNRTVELGGWNEVALAELLQELENSDEIDIAASGYDADDLDNLLRDIAGYEDGDWSAEEHWVGLPEYQQGDEVSKLKMIVHFENEDGRQDFAQRLGLKITEKTNNTWWPVKTQRDLASVRFETDDN